MANTTSLVSFKSNSSRERLQLVSNGLNQLRAFSLLLGIPKVTWSGVFIAENTHRCAGLLYTYRENALVAFSLKLGITKEEYSGVFIAENAHRCRSPTLHLQGNALVAFSLKLGIRKRSTAAFSLRKTPIDAEALLYTSGKCSSRISPETEYPGRGVQRRFHYGKRP